MLSHEEVEAALKKRAQQEKSKRAFTQSDNEHVRAAAEALVPTIPDEYDIEKPFDGLVEKLDRLSSEQRIEAFSFHYPNLAREINDVYENFTQLIPYSIDYTLGRYSGAGLIAFRSPKDVDLAHKHIAILLQHYLSKLIDYNPDPVWLATWAATSLEAHPDLTSWLLASAINNGNEEVLDVLLQEPPLGHTIMNYLPLTLMFCNGERAGSEFEKLLLNAGRQEGLRESLFYAAGQAPPQTLLKVLRLIVEHGLFRFSSSNSGFLYGFGLDLKPKQVKPILLQLERNLSDPAATASQIKDLTDPIELYIALFSLGINELETAVSCCEEVLSSEDPSRRFVAVKLLSYFHSKSSAKVLLKAAYDPDLLVATTAAETLTWSDFDSAGPAYDALEALIERVDKKPVRLNSPLGDDQITVSKVSVADLFIPHWGSRMDIDRVMPYRKELSPYRRSMLIQELGESPLSPYRRRLSDQEPGDPSLTAEQREVLLSHLADTSSDVRKEAYTSIHKLTEGYQQNERRDGKTVTMAYKKRIKLTEQELLEFEPLLKRKPSDLRNYVIDLILRAEDQWIIAAGKRMLASKHEQQRLAGVEILRQLSARKGEAAQTAKELLNQHEDSSESVEYILEKAIDKKPNEELTRATGFGLFDVKKLTAPTPPQAVGFTVESDGSKRLIQLLDELVEEHKHHEFTGYWKATTIGETQGREMLSQCTMEDRQKFNFEKFPLLQIWLDFNANLPTDARDPDGLELLRAHLLIEDIYHSENSPIKDVKYKSQISDILLMLLYSLEDDAAKQTITGLIDHLQDRLSTIVLNRSKNKIYDQGRYTESQTEFQKRQEAGYVRELITKLLSIDQRGARFCAITTRLWGLERWLTETNKIFYKGPDDQRLPERLYTETIEHAFLCGAATEDDLFDCLLGPAWAERGHTMFSGLDDDSFQRPELKKYRQQAIQRLLEVEFGRGEAMTEASNGVVRLGHSGGMDILIRALVALGKDKFRRGWVYYWDRHDNLSRSDVFSHIVVTTLPEKQDTPELFAKLVAEAGISPIRLRETACYAPQWAKHVEHALAINDFADAVWWLHAHTKDQRWAIHDQILEKWKQEVSKRTDLTEQQLVDGAVDTFWFERFAKSIGSKELKLLFSAAKYCSSSSGHKRAELFARALTGDVKAKELTDRIQEKRNQDSLRALGLLPLPKNAAKRAAQLQKHYRLAEQFKAESKQFGSQRRASETLAFEIFLENLARNAGYRDNTRLIWAIEAEATRDLTGEGLTQQVKDVTFTLSIDDQGAPRLQIQRDGKSLKTVPKAVAKEAKVKALKERASGLKKQLKSVKNSLENAMIRGDLIQGDELVNYSQHALLWPALSTLVLHGKSGTGMPAQDGKALVDHEGVLHPVAPEDSLRVAHPADLLRSKNWRSWQQLLLKKQIVQPFKQVFRELYVAVENERADDGSSRRYAGHQVVPDRAAALLGSRSWTSVYSEGAMQRIFHQEQIGASIFGFSPLEVEDPVIENVVFFDLANDSLIDIAEVPERIFSEVMRDVDLVVSVAHTSGTNPEASSSTVQMRSSLLEETLSLLEIKNVRIEQRRALIEGQLASWSVHLGSANVHTLPGGEVCIVPVTSQQRGRTFLPFADDDPKTAEIISKVLLLAHDHKIKDPLILEQIRS